MTVSSDLFLAVLAMDAYNQEYEPGIAGVGKHIGLADVLKIPLPADAQADGFSASAYSLNGHKVISYRGTDDITGTAIKGGSGSDLLRGWTIGAGFSAGTRTWDAKEFYYSVTKNFMNARNIKCLLVERCGVAE